LICRQKRGAFAVESDSVIRVDRQQWFVWCDRVSDFFVEHVSNRRVDDMAGFIVNQKSLCYTLA